MILHLIDDEKFIDGMIKSFEDVYTGQNIYLLRIPFAGYKIQNINYPNIKFAVYPSNEYNYYISRLQEYEAVIIHLLNEYKIDLIRQASPNVNFIWNIWGMDFYSLLSNMELIQYTSKTARVVKDLSSDSFKSLSHLKLYNFYLHYKKFTYRKRLADVFFKIKYFSTVLPNEEKIVRDYLHLNAKYIPFNYDFMDNLISETEINSRSQLGNNILVGNSGTPANNHIDILETLSKIDIGERNIYVPLSYGNTKYIEYIMKFGNEILGDKFIPITKFLDFNAYVELIKSCDICLMNHYRQQGVGNLVLLLWLGAKVFINTNNPFFEFSLRNNIKVFDIREINDKPIILDEVISSETSSKNKRMIYNYFSKEKIRERIYNYIKSATDNG